MWLIIALQFLGSTLIDKFLGHIFPKTRARIICREKLKDIAHNFALCIEDTSSPGNLQQIIAEARDLIEKKLPGQEVIDKHLPGFINFQFKRIGQLNREIQFFQDTIDHSQLNYTARLSDEFIRVSSESHQIFSDFVRTLELNLDKDKSEYVFQDLKRNPRGYPVFENLYTDAVNTLKKITKEASKKLPEVTPLETFVSLPKIWETHIN